jgi:hypothetical protein
MALVPAFTGLVGFAVQVFLILRYYTLSKSMLISCVLALFALVSVGSAIASTVVVIRLASYKDRRIFTKPIFVWLYGTVVADWLISGALVLHSWAGNAGLICYLGRLMANFYYYLVGVLSG